MNLLVGSITEKLGIYEKAQTDESSSVPSFEAVNYIKVYTNLEILKLRN